MNLAAPPGVWVLPAAILVLAVATGCADGEPTASGTPTAAATSAEPRPTTPTDGSAPGGTAAATPRTFPGTSSPRPRPAQPTAAPPAPSSAAGPVRIDAVELLPEDPSPGGQLVVLRNDGDRAVPVDCWTVRTAAGKTAHIRADKAIEPGTMLRLFPESRLFDSTDSVSLLDGGGGVVDRTPELSDTTGDDQLWFRAASGVWRFGRDYAPAGTTDDARLVTDTC